MEVQGDDLWREIAKTGARRIGVGKKPKCHSSRYGEYIDHLIVGPELVPMVKAGSFDELTFTEGFSQHKKISDHCPISIELN